METGLTPERNLFLEMLNRRRLAVVSAAAASLAGAAVLTTGGANSAKRQPPVSVAVFRGEVGGESNIELGSWGSGTAEVSKQAVLVGSSTIKITTQGPYQGGRIAFRQPIDLTPALANRNTYMRFQVRFTGAGSTQQAVGGGGPQDGGPGIGGGVSGELLTRAASPFRRMRYLVTMADGTKYELLRPVDVPPSEDPDAWTPMSFPFSAITKAATASKKPLPTGEGAKIKEIALFGDRYGQFSIGEISVITDATEINIAPLDDVVGFAQTQTVFAGSAEGGASTLKFSWDFDASDGIQEDAVGRSITHVFPRTTDASGQKTYKVTLTVSDVDGLKKPESTTLELNVTN